MVESDIALIELHQPDGNFKLRPTLILKRLPKYNDFLVCGISTQLHQYIKDYDEILDDKDLHFHKTGLHKTSLIRIFFLAVVPENKIAGTIGKISSSLHESLLERLAIFLTLKERK